MSEVTMTMYEALSKKRIYEDRVSKMTPMKVVHYATADVEKIDGVDREDYVNGLKSNFDSCTHLISNWINIKSAINESNAITKITVDGKEYTVADAISRYNNLSSEENLIRSYVNQYNKVVNEINTRNERMLNPEKISDYIKNVLGDSKKDDALITTTTNNYIAKNKVELIDPNDIATVCNEKMKEITEFREKIHFALMQSNVVTNITVDLED